MALLQSLNTDSIVLDCRGLAPHPDTGAGRYLRVTSRTSLPRTNDVIDNQCRYSRLPGSLPAYRMYQRERC
jgi:hypothetical protein